MKTKNIKKAILALFAVSVTVLVSAQTNYSFNKYMLVSGTEKKQGAVYRFSSVKPDVDAIITIDKLTSSASLDSFDISAPGFAAELQPAFTVAPHCWGYVQFNIQFVKAGTSVPVAISNIPLKGKIYNADYKNVKLDIVSSTATSFKVRMYSANQHGYALNTKADVLLQDGNDEDDEPSRNAVALIGGDSKDK
ncbi:MAG TPA: hypothetical protein VKT28_01795 [Puia sp.]|nr:hypothetical protein [Puia sp.]